MLRPDWEGMSEGQLRSDIGRRIMKMEAKWKTKKEICGCDNRICELMMQGTESDGTDEVLW